MLIVALPACGARADAEAASMRDEVVPALTGRVVDDADLLTPQAEKRIAARLAGLEAVARDQLVVVTVPSLRGKAIDAAGLEMGRAWGIGQEGLDNGVILLVAPNERQARIEVGTGLEGLLTDERASAIMQRDMLPAFRTGRFEAGIDGGVSAIAALLRADRRRPAYSRRQPLR